MAPPQRNSVPVVLARGKRLFEQNCAVFHGAHAEGDPSRRYPGPYGKFSLPLSGMVHSWHRSIARRHGMIKNGSPSGRGNMPAWRGRLSDDDMDAVIAWFQSL